MPDNLHATAIVVGDRGLLVTGAAGSGKTTLALMLVSRASFRGLHATFVSDDQVLLRPASGHLVASAPAAIAGLAERRGPGPLAVAFTGRAVIDGLVELVDATAAPRIEDEPWRWLGEVRLPRLRLAARQPVAATLAVEAWIAADFQVAS